MILRQTGKTNCNLNSIAKYITDIITQIRLYFTIFSDWMQEI